MTTKEWLERYKTVKGEVKALRDAKAEALSAASGKATAYSDTKSNTSFGNATETKIIKYVAISEMLEAKINELLSTQSEILLTINNVQDGILRTLLTERYINRKSWELVAEAIDYNSVLWVRTSLHSRALFFVQKQLEKF